MMGESDTAPFPGLEEERLRLTIRSGGAKGASATVGAERIVVGRGGDCDLVVPDLKVSRRHAAVEALPEGGVSLVDLGSGNGTFVNGRRVQTARLEGNEQIQVGDTVLLSSRGPGSGASGDTVLGNAPPESHSALHRLLVQRSVRRATFLSAAAVAAAALLVLLLVTGVLNPGESTTETAEDVVKGAEPSTVLIEGRREGGGGTGWVLDAREGLVVTNAHVVDGSGDYGVGVGGELRKASLVGISPCEDLAVLRVEKTSGLRSMPLGRQSTVKLGESVVAVGYPRNASLEANLTSTTGVVSVARSRYRERTLDLPFFPNVIQTDAAINPGSSGGPLMDLDGKLIGVTSAGRTLTPDGRIVQGQNYAIGVDRVRTVTAVLRTGRSIGWTGTTFEYLTPRELRKRDLPPGLLIAGAAQGSAAERAGLGNGKSLLVTVNGQPLDNSLASYCDAIRAARPGERVTFGVLPPGAASPRRVRLTAE